MAHPNARRRETSRAPHAARHGRFRVCLGAALALAVQGCHGCRSVDVPVSSPPGDPGGAHRRFSQSETTLVRVDQPAGRPRGEPPARFVAAYNDATSAMVAGSGECWAFNAERPTLDGWARSDDFGATWLRQEQLPVTGVLQGQGVRARHGDPWLAAWSSKSSTTPSVVLYVSVAQSGLARTGGPFTLLLSRSRDGGLSFEESILLIDPQPVVPDGPKVAIAGDGAMAVVIWNEGRAGIPFKLVWNLTDPTMMTSATALIHPESIADPPEPGCTFSGATAHPRIAAGVSTFYAAARVSYSCPSGFQQRLEVYRNPSAGFAFGAPWRRILSVRPPASLPSASFGILNAQDIAGTPQFGTRTDRASSLPSLAVGESADGEFVILADIAVEAGTLADELQRERVYLYRVPQADTCDAPHHRGDLDSCGSTLTGRAIDDLATASDKLDAIDSRAGVWESKPAVFTGKVPDGTVDERVGVVWYTQPYKGRMSVTDEMRARTIVEAAVSNDGGLTFEGPFVLTAESEGIDHVTPDPAIGNYFHPCQMLCNGYYGEYISGAFQFAAGAPKAILATWGDSREGCADQSVTNHHHHVWSGAVRAD